MESSKISEFYHLSSQLTGYNLVKLHGRGQGELYYSSLTEILGEQLVSKLLSEFKAIYDQYKSDSNNLKHHLQKNLLENDKWGPVCRNIIKMWYMGYWYQMPLEWRENFISSINDTTRVLTAQTYVEGLVWEALGQHPQSAKQPGYGTWAVAPGINLNE